ncbi:uncharacterized protein ACR2FA_011281 [Aphomia sociella]
MSGLCFSLFVFAILTVGYAEKRVVLIPDETVPLLLENLNKCGTELGASAEALMAVRLAKPLDTAEFKDILHCFCSRSGFFESDGLVMVDKATLLFPENDRDIAKKIMKECNKRQETSAADTELGFYKCFVEKSLVTLKF